MTLVTEIWYSTPKLNNMTIMDGMTWEKRDLPAKESLFKVRMDGDFGVIVADYGMLLVTQNGGKTWRRFYQVAKRTPVWLIDVYPIASSNRKGVIIGKGVLEIIDFSKKD